MIDKNKQYRTRDGREVRIYATDGYPSLTVHGAIKLEDCWEIVAWRSDGRLGGYAESDSDLIEVKPRIKREVWVNVYRHDDGFEFAECYGTRREADHEHGDARIACVRLTIDCEEGEGL